ncbi:MAG TPA: hypothetical protein VFZ53_25810 [Polyangiaceae bacterium]
MKAFERSSSRGVLGVALLAAACSPSLPAPASGKPEPAQEMPKSFKCDASKGQTRPLIVEWNAPDRAALEALAKRNQLVVHFEGCTLEPLRQCAAPPQPYRYTGVTPKDEVVSMTSVQELYANVPVHAVELEGKLAQSGELRAAMKIVGMYEATGNVPAVDQLVGDCDNATHVVTALTVGAFEFSAGRSREGSASVQVLGAAAGAKDAASKETLSRDGDVAACSSASGADTAPPERCGALLRLEVATLVKKGEGIPTCGPGTRLEGKACKPIPKPSELAPEDVSFVDDRAGFHWGDRCYKHFKAGALPFARAACQKGLDAGPEPKVRGAILYNLALVDEASGDGKAACEWLRQSLAVRPGVGAVQSKFDALDCRKLLAGG